jgi:hypothetical protein
VTLYTLATDPLRGILRSRPALNTAFTYLAVSIICMIIDKVYALFGHGVASNYMSLMYLYPLLGGVLPFFLLWFLVLKADYIRHYRLFYNCYNSGIAMLTVGSMLAGVFEIAGTASPYLIIFTVGGWAILGGGLLGYLWGLIHHANS